MTLSLRVPTMLWRVIFQKSAVTDMPVTPGTSSTKPKVRPLDSVGFMSGLPPVM